MSVYNSYCDCCRLGIEPGMGSDCPRCGYPINSAKEEAFLRASLHDLGRVASYGGAHMTIVQLINYYERRLASLSQRASSIMAVSPAQAQYSPGTPVMRPEAHTMSFNAAPSIRPSSSQQPFSLKTFFTDQSINIVASLGAFLILIGSLSFIATTPDLLTACIILLAVHAIFGIVGAITYRFPSLRIVSIVYTAIFALQVPLVGFAVYRFVAGSLFHIPASLLIALAASYATLAYATLSVYQKFKPFGYLAAAALIVADLATATTLHLAIWWWPLLLLILALPLQLFVRRAVSSVPQTAFTMDVLREPAQVLLGVCVVAGAVGVLYAFSIGSWMGARSGLRLSIAVTTFVLALWLGFFLWHTKRYEFARIALTWALLVCSQYAMHSMHRDPSMSWL